MLGRGVYALRANVSTDNRFRNVLYLYTPAILEQHVFV